MLGFARGLGRAEIVEDTPQIHLCFVSLLSPCCHHHGDISMC